MAASYTLSPACQRVGSESTALHHLDPLTDTRWSDLVASHPRSSVFHRREWLEALALTYDYKPVVLTSSPSDSRLTDGVVFCAVRSWITGTRLVSLPFSDHCEPLIDQPEQAVDLANWLREESENRGWKYVELRPLSSLRTSAGVLGSGATYWLHTLDISPPLDQMFQRLHKNSMQRRIQRAEREQLSYEAGRSEQLLREFYGLLVMTRRRHQLLPQPRAWFRNLIRCMGAGLTIRVARKGHTAIAAMLTLRHRDTVIYKYGCSDERVHHLAGMPFLFWKLIEESKAAGAEQIDLGRTDIDNLGLTAFKDHLGATRRPITYQRYPVTEKETGKKLADSSVIRRLLAAVPSGISPWAGSLVYRHLG